MKYLVTGGAGFIGSNLVRHLLAAEADVEIVVLDALTYAGNVESLTDVSSDERYRFVRGDICDPEIVQEVMTGIDIVFHLAAES
ncbi:MAG: NAD-dependent epimerase/dehydratase family protein, partial [Gemmatimonadales bacterium]|nr:NAD-dependent epimerase/dehydratase family protein [Gemmatimonadales bacterium]